jgi:site-specific recombinase XerD
VANELQRSKRIVIDNKYEEAINPENLKLLNKHIRDMEMRELSPKSIYNYKRDLIQWMSYLNKEQFNNNVIEVTEDDIEEFIFYCRQEGNNTERIKRRTSSISAFYKFLRKKKLIKENPMEFISRPKKGLPVVVQTFLTPSQVEEMREQLKLIDDLQLTTYVEFSLATMARVNAVSNVTWEQIDFDNMVVEDVLEKEGKIVTLYFDEYVRELLLKLKQQREEDGIECKYVFITNHKDGYDKVTVNAMSGWTKKVGKSIGVNSLHPHDFRHSGATLRKNAGMELEMISTLLNHSGTDVTRNHYIKEDKSKIASEFRKYKV